MLYAHVDGVSRLPIKAAHLLHDCTCAACGQPVIAACGDKMAWHWRHANSAPDCELFNPPTEIISRLPPYVRPPVEPEDDEVVITKYHTCPSTGHQWLTWRHPRYTWPMKVWDQCPDCNVVLTTNQGVPA